MLRSVNIFKSNVFKLSAKIQKESWNKTKRDNEIKKLVSSAYPEDGERDRKDLWMVT